jgi:hypothetical protein
VVNNLHHQGNLAQVLWVNLMVDHFHLLQKLDLEYYDLHLQIHHLLLKYQLELILHHLHL